MDIHNEYIANEKNLVFYAGKAITNREHVFYDENDDLWVFANDPGFVGFTFNIWEEREGGRLMISWDSNQLTPSANGFFLTSPATTTDIEKGKYYYEIEYIVAGGYPVLIAFGQAKFI